MERNSRIHRWFGTSSRPERGIDIHETVLFAEPDLDAIRAAMRLALAPCSDAHRLRAGEQIEQAVTVIELWLMRADIFQYLAMDIGQMAAAKQMVPLMPMFEGAVPAVAGLRNFSDNRGHDPRLC